MSNTHTMRRAARARCLPATGLWLLASCGGSGGDGTGTAGSGTVDPATTTGTASTATEPTSTPTGAPTTEGTGDPSGDPTGTPEQNIIPPERLVDWVPGVTVGVPGGIPERTKLCATVLRAPDAPQSTTGTGAAASNQITVASVADFAVGHGVAVADGACEVYSDPCVLAPLMTTITAIAGDTLTLNAPLVNAIAGTAVTHNDTPAIQDAINACPEGEVVFMPAGKYRITHGISIGYGKKNISVRGEGDATILESSAGGGGGTFAVAYSGDYLWAPDPNNPQRHRIMGDVARGSTELPVADTSMFVVGNMASIAQKNDPTLPVTSVSTFEYLRRQMVRVVAKTDTTLTVAPPLAWALQDALEPIVVGAQQQVEGIGLEDFMIDNTTSTAAFVIFFEQTYGSWVKNVHSYFAPNYHVHFYDTLNCEMRGSNLDVLNHEGPNGAGFLMGGLGGSSSNLIEDNIIYRSFPHMEINGGATGNVFAYNFAENNFVFGVMGVSFDSNHAPHNSYNLWEGNVGSVFQSDGYFGSESEGTLFRNWFHATCDTDITDPPTTTDQFGRAVGLNRFARNFSVVGNILGRTGYTYTYDNGTTAQDGVGTSYEVRYIYNLGLPNIGNGGFNGMFAPPWADMGKDVGPSGYQELDLGVAATLIRRGNWNAADNGVAAGEALDMETLPPSLFRASKPEWFGGLAWPPFDPLAPNQSYDAIPAGYRFVHGKDPD
jgi:hypothetical protein